MELKELRGISEKRAADFEKLHIRSAEDLIRFFPRSYLDMTERVKISSCYHNDMALLLCRVASPPQTARGKGNRPYVRVLCEQDGEYFSVYWFNQPYVRTKLQEGREYLFYGRVQNRYGMPSMVNPTFEPAETNRSLRGIVPVYSLKGNLSQRTVRTAVAEALDKCSVASAIPVSLQSKYALMPLKRAYREVHAPSDMETQREAAARIALEEYFLLLSAFLALKGGKDDARAFEYSCGAREVKEFAERFPFSFTEGQKKAVNEIYQNLHGPGRMNRLLQGDVGCGKTAVSLCAVYMAAASGHQALFLSPTEVLASQTYALLRRYLPEFSSAYLAGSTPAAEKKRIKSAFADGSVRILCGTHAVLQGDVAAQDLALCVCDEQQRFGVGQRSVMGEKSAGADVLVMSATPIPRTLSLIFYGDLDISEIRDKPKARAETVTAIVPPEKYDAMLGYIAGCVRNGEQCYFVCPRVEDDEEGTVMSVTELYEELKRKMPSVRVALLHGGMKERDKAAAVESFRRRETDCLVSTTVIEVGVDVPDATVMVIWNAERFGLSQLHQLRGRVGRGEKKSWCFLLPGSETEESRERLSVLKSTNDGFRIAEEDLRLRGGGDFLGLRQSGRAALDLGNLQYPPEILFTAKKLADEAVLCGDSAEVRRAALEKYDRLKKVVLN